MNDDHFTRPCARPASVLDRRDGEAIFLNIITVRSLSTTFLSRQSHSTCKKNTLLLYSDRCSLSDPRAMFSSPPQDIGSLFNRPAFRSPFIPTTPSPLRTSRNVNV